MSGYRGTPFDMSGTTTLVAGANSGIGLGIAEAIASAGGGVILWGRREERNRQAADALAHYGIPILCQSVDVADGAAIERAFAEAVEQAGPIRAVFVNAGQAGKRAPIAELTVDDFLPVLNVNLLGSFHLIRTAVRHMLGRAESPEKGGSIVLTGSIAEKMGQPGTTLYTSTKGALAALVRSLAVELGPHGIRVNSIVPGVIRSEIGHSAAALQWAVNRSPLGRIGEAAEVGPLALYLASSAGSFHTGDSLVLDGGISAGG
jgi:NAD(P)-dependent dehydrogenase (short-subunit alcohol dehydrogenase family)